MIQGSFVEGFRRTVPLFVGVIPFGLAYGISARTVGLSLFHTVLMSLTVFAGAAQFIAVEMIRQKAMIFSILVMTLIVNIRHILMSLSLKPYLADGSKVHRLLLSFGIHDESYAVSSIYFKEKNAGSMMFLFSASLLMYIGWVGSSAIGHILGTQIGDPLKWGLDFAMPATFIGILIPQIKTRRILIVVLISGGIAISMKLILSNSMFIIIAAIIGAFIGYILEKFSK